MDVAAAVSVAIAIASPPPSPVVLEAPSSVAHSAIAPMVLSASCSDIRGPSGRPIAAISHTLLKARRQAEGPF